MRILMIEGDRENARSMSSCLKREFGQDLQVEIAESGEEALERLEHVCSLDEPEVLIMNSILPGISGLELVNSIRQGWDPRCMVMVTDKQDPMLTVEALRSGVNKIVVLNHDFPANLVSAVDRSLQYSKIITNHQHAQAPYSYQVAPIRVPSKVPNNPQGPEYTISTSGLKTHEKAQLRLLQQFINQLERAPKHTRRATKGRREQDRYR